MLTRSLSKTLGVKNPSRRKKYFQQGCLLSLDSLADGEKLKMEEEKAARKAAAQARQEFRQRRAAEMAEKAQQMPEDVRLKLSALSDGAQAAYHILRKKSREQDIFLRPALFYRNSVCSPRAIRAL